MKAYRIQCAATLLASVTLVAPSVCVGMECRSPDSPYRRPIPVVAANYARAAQAPTVTSVRWGRRGYRPYYGRTHGAYRPYYRGSRAYVRPYGYRTYGYRPYVVRPYVYGYRPYGIGYSNYNPWYFGFGPQYY